MPLSVRLDVRTESLLARLARRRNRTKSEVIREALATLARTEAEVASRASPYEAIAHLVGCAKGGPRDLSERTGEKVRTLLSRRVRR